MASRRTRSARGETLKQDMPQTPQPSVAERLAHVYWIGGSIGTGKTSIARMLAERAGIEAYECDRIQGELVRRAAARVASTPRDGLQVDLRGAWESPQTQLSMDFVLEADLFPFIIDDLLLRYSTRPVIVEGGGLLPAQVAPHLADRSRAVWLLSTPAYRTRTVTASRALCGARAAVAADASRTVRAWIRKDRLLSEEIRKQAAWYGLRTRTIGDAHGIVDIAADVAAELGLPARGA